MNTSTCAHDDREASTMPNGAPAWECEYCGHLTPMTAREVDWCHPTKPLCNVCHHSADFGGPLVERDGWLGSFLIHEGCR